MVWDRAASSAAAPADDDGACGEFDRQRGVGKPDPFLFVWTLGPLPPVAVRPPGPGLSLIGSCRLDAAGEKFDALVCILLLFSAFSNAAPIAACCCCVSVASDDLSLTPSEVPSVDMAARNYASSRLSCCPE